MASKARIRVNDPCPCGSGKKYKRCCGTPALRAREQRRANLIFAAIAALMVAAASSAILVIRRSSEPTSSAPTGQVWSAEHGHFHDAITGRPIGAPSTGDVQLPQATNPGLTIPGLTPPGPAPPGQVWSAEHGHYHDANTGAAPSASAVGAPGGAVNAEPPGPAPPGQVWSPEHGHYHPG